MKAALAKSQRTRGYHIQVLDRAFQLLDHLAECRDGLSLTDLAGRLKLHKSTAHRIVMGLEGNRRVARDFETGRWCLGHRLSQLGMSVLWRQDLSLASMDALRELVE